jgi:hypothetical protein
VLILLTVLNTPLLDKDICWGVYADPLSTLPVIGRANRFVIYSSEVEKILTLLGEQIGLLYSSEVESVETWSEKCFGMYTLAEIFTEFFLCLVPNSEN